MAIDISEKNNDNILFFYCFFFRYGTLTLYTRARECVPLPAAIGIYLFFLNVLTLEEFGISFVYGVWMAA